MKNPWHITGTEIDQARTYAAEMMIDTMKDKVPDNVLLMALVQAAVTLSVELGQPKSSFINGISLLVDFETKHRAAKRAN